MPTKYCYSSNATDMFLCIWNHWQWGYRGRKGWPDSSTNLLHIQRLVEMLRLVSGQKSFGFMAFWSMRCFSSSFWIRSMLKKKNEFYLLDYLFLENLFVSFLLFCLSLFLQRTYLIITRHTVQVFPSMTKEVTVLSAHFQFLKGSQTQEDWNCANTLRHQKC